MLVHALAKVGQNADGPPTFPVSVSPAVYGRRLADVRDPLNSFDVPLRRAETVHLSLPPRRRRRWRVLLLGFRGQHLLPVTSPARTRVHPRLRAPTRASRRAGKADTPLGAPWTIGKTRRYAGNWVTETGTLLSISSERKPCQFHRGEGVSQLCQRNSDVRSGSC